MPIARSEIELIRRERKEATAARDKAQAILDALPPKVYRLGELFYDLELLMRAGYGDAIVQLEGCDCYGEAKSAELEGNEVVIHR